MDEQTILAGSENFGNVSVCPGGVVHVNLLHCSVKFLPQDFIKFCELISKARLKFEMPPRASGKPHLQVVTSDTCEDPSPDQEK